GEVTWRAKAQAFGTTQVHLNTIDNALRFPGQYFDEETGLYQNYFRDYDPQLGRYVQSDPIGLLGGVNEYEYALSQVLIMIDLYGLSAGASDSYSEKCMPWFSGSNDWRDIGPPKPDLESVASMTFSGVVTCKWNRKWKQKQVKETWDQEICYVCECLNGETTCGVEIRQGGKVSEYRVNVSDEFAYNVGAVSVKYGVEDEVTCVSPWNPRVKAVGPFTWRH
ncbi:RHS repeat-associated core domain-containing protein, partial [Pseudomonas mendocina]|uniref:RHS repeat-associated core domain-containing protein n=1 Tax=Ectopseudomonas mendocina TaxID=300 RepID=UPI0023DA8216